MILIFWQWGEHPIAPRPVSWAGTAWFPAAAPMQGVLSGQAYLPRYFSGWRIRSSRSASSSQRMACRRRCARTWTTVGGSQQTALSLRPRAGKNCFMVMVFFRHQPRAAPAAGIFAAQTRRCEIRPARSMVQTPGDHPPQSRPGAPVHAISTATGGPARRRPPMPSVPSRDTPRFDQPQHDPADERQRTNRRRDEMVGKVQPQEPHHAF